MEKKSSYFVTIFYYVEDTVYIYSWKKNGKFFTHFGDALCKKYIFLSRVVLNLTIEWTPGVWWCGIGMNCSSTL